MQEEEKTRNWKDKLSGFLNSGYFIAVIIVLMTVIAFSLGRISGLQEKRPAVKVINNSPLNPISSTNTLQNTAATSAASNIGTSASQSEQVVASKNGTKYHYPWCAGAKQISPQNLITFNSIEEARAKGYTPASNCKGLK
jgi:hypothetical protein